MIYIPIELQLQWIREDLKEIKRAVRPIDYVLPPATYCPDCNLAIAFGHSYGKCAQHAPEFNNVLSLR